MVVGTGSDKGFLSDAEVREIVKEGLAKIDLDGKSVLILTPDSTRTAPLPMLFRLMVELIEPRASKARLHDSPRHASAHERGEDKRPLRPHARGALRPLSGHQHLQPRLERPRRSSGRSARSPNEIVKEISEGLLEESVPVSINKRIFDYDEVLVLGPTFPHEVVGFSGGYKYFFPGICGSEFLNFFHWLGALITNVKIIGVKDTPVRRMITKAMEFVPVSRHCISLVTTTDGLKGVFVGTCEEAYSAAADLSAKVHIVYKPRSTSSSSPSRPRCTTTSGRPARPCTSSSPSWSRAARLSSRAARHRGVVHARQGHRPIGYHCRDYFLRTSTGSPAFPAA